MVSNQNLTKLATKWCIRLFNLSEDETTKRSLQNLKKYFESIKEIPELTSDKQRLIANVYEKLLVIDQSPKLTDEILADTLEFASSRIQTTAEIITKGDETLNSKGDQLLLTVLSNFYLCFGSLYLTISYTPSSVTITEAETKPNKKQELLEELLTTAYDDVILELIEEDMPYDEYFNEAILASIQVKNYNQSDYVKKTFEVIQKVEQKFKLLDNSLIEFIISHNSPATRHNPNMAEKLRDLILLYREKQQEPTILDFVIHAGLDFQVDEEYFSTLFKSYTGKVLQETVEYVKEQVIKICIFSKSSEFSQLFSFRKRRSQKL